MHSDSQTSSRLPFLYIPWLALVYVCISGNEKDFVAYQYPPYRVNEPCSGCVRHEMCRRSWVTGLREIRVAAVCPWITNQHKKDSCWYQ